MDSKRSSTKVHSMAEYEVRTPISEVLSRIEGKIDALVASLHEKADKAELDRLEARVSIMEREDNKEAIEALKATKDLEGRLRLIEKDLSEMSNLEKRVAEIDKDAAKGTAVAENERQLKEVSSKLRWQVAGVIVSLLLGLGGITVGLINALRH